MRPVLLMCAHGTRSPAGEPVIEALRRLVALRCPDVDVAAAYVDVRAPLVGDRLAALCRDGRRVVVVPLLLSTGYHVEVDIGQAVAAHPGAVAVGPLGPHPWIADVLAQRLWQAGGPPEGRQVAVVLAATGSTRPGPADQVRRQAELLAMRLGRPVDVGFAAAGAPTVAQAVAAARDSGARAVAVATYLLAPGVFHETLAEAGADHVAAPLGAHALLADLVTARYTAAAAAHR